MAEVLRFDRHRPPLLPVELMDDAHTIINLIPPTVELQEELRANLGRLSALLSREDSGMVDTLYDLAARLMSCNRNLLRVTGHDLRTTYKMDAADLVVFFYAYADFIREIENAKN